MITHKISVSIILILFVFLVFFFASSIISPNGSKLDNTKNINQAVLIVISPEGERRVFEGPLYEKTTILDVMLASSIAGNFVFEYKVEDKGVVIEKYYDREVSLLIGGRCEGLCFSRNGKDISASSINSKIIYPGDIVQVSMETK